MTEPCLINISALAEQHQLMTNSNPIRTRMIMRMIFEINEARIEVFKLLNLIHKKERTAIRLIRQIRRN